MVVRTIHDISEVRDLRRNVDIGGAFLASPSSPSSLLSLFFLLLPPPFSSYHGPLAPPLLPPLPPLLFLFFGLKTLL